MVSQKKYILYGLILLPIVVFYSFSAAFSTNVPWFDDIENIPFFLTRYLDATTWYDRLEAFLRPNNEHRVVSARLLVYLQYVLTGKINFRVLVLVGNLTVLGIFLLISRAYLKSNGKLVHLIPAAFFIFNLQFYSMTFMTIMSMQYQLIICEVFLGLYLLTKPLNSAFIGAVLVGILGTFSMGNGLMIWPTGTLFLLYLMQWKRLGSWVTMGILAITAYFSGYAFVQGNDQGFVYFFNHPFKIIIGFFTFVGGILDWVPRISFEKRMILPFLGGVFIFSFFIFYTLGVLSRSDRWQKLVPPKMLRLYRSLEYFNTLSPSLGAFWVSCLIYLFINSALVVFFRTRFDYQLVLWATYKIYPGTLMAITSMLALQIFSFRCKSLLWGGLLIAAVISCVSSYWFFVPQVIQDRKQRLAFAFNQRRNGVGLGAEKNSVFASFILNTLNSAEQKGVYHLPDPLLNRRENEIEKMIRDTSTNLPSLEVKIARKPYGFEITNESLPYVNDKNNGVFVLLYSPDHFYIIAAETLGFFQKQPIGFRANCPTGPLYDETYQVGIWVIQKEREQLWRTPEQVTLP